MTSEFCLEIAGARVAVVLPSWEWHARLVERYAEFLSNAAASWRVELTRDPEAESLLPGTVLHDGQETHFHVLSYRGAIDLARRCATVSCPSEHHAASALERTLSFIYMEILPREHGALWMHAAGVEMNGRGYAFCGRSGAGKTTVAKLAQGRAHLLCDENLVLQVAAHEALLHSTPFWGHSTPPALIQRHRAVVPLTAMLTLDHGPDFRITRLSAAEAVSELLDTEKVAIERVDSAQAWLETAALLIDRVPVYRLTFRPDVALWDFLAAQGT